MVDIMSEENGIQKNKSIFRRNAWLRTRNFAINYYGYASNAISLMATLAIMSCWIAILISRTRGTLTLQTVLIAETVMLFACIALLAAGIAFSLVPKMVATHRARILYKNMPDNAQDKAKMRRETTLNAAAAVGTALDVVGSIILVAGSLLCVLMVGKRMKDIPIFRDFGIAYFSVPLGLSFFMLSAIILLVVGGILSPTPLDRHGQPDHMKKFLTIGLPLIFTVIGAVLLVTGACLRSAALSGHIVGLDPADALPETLRIIGAAILAVTVVLATVISLCYGKVAKQFTVETNMQCDSNVQTEPTEDGKFVKKTITYKTVIVEPIGNDEQQSIPSIRN